MVNTAQPLIGLTMDSSPANDKRPIAVGSDINFQNNWYVRYLESADCLQVHLCTLSSFESVADLIARLDGLILTGGDDVYAPVYGHKILPGDWRIDKARTFFELALIEQALFQHKPIFGICRGCQMLNVAFGGTLIQDIPSQLPRAIEHRSLNRPQYHFHEIEVAADSALNNLTATERLSVTSSHHQAIDRLADELRATAFAPDRVIEAVEAKDPTQPVFGVQWHPEGMPEEPSSRRLLEKFIGLCKQENV